MNPKIKPNETIEEYELRMTAIGDGIIRKITVITIYCIGAILFIGLVAQSWMLL